MQPTASTMVLVLVGIHGCREPGAPVSGEEAQAPGAARTEARGPASNPSPVAEVKKADGVPSAAGAGEAPPTDAPPDSAQVGKPAPDFLLPAADGTMHRLSDHRGKIVVLEWFNPGCPFVRYAHTQGPLVDLAPRLAGPDLVFLAINSGAPGKQGSGRKANLAAAERFGMDYPVLLDETGAVGRAYGAVKTPHMFVVAPDGALAYAGGLDNAPMGEVDGDGPVVSYVEDAVAALRAGKPVSHSTTRPYGCSVKYGS